MSGPPPPPPGSFPPGAAPPMAGTPTPPPPGAGIPQGRLGPYPVHGYVNPASRIDSKERKKADRAAARSLAAKPEMLAIATVSFVLWILAVDANPVGVLFGCGLFAVFGALYMANGDGVLAVLILSAVGLTAIAVVANDGLRDPASLLYLIPGIVVLACDAAATLNGYRRRRSEISVRIFQIIGQNLAAIVASAIATGLILRFLSTAGPQVAWPWFAAIVLALTGGTFAALILLRRTSQPADNRRYSPGRRMVPPPR